VKSVAVYNIKGGVGKTSTAVNLAYLAARQGQRTLLWDLDPQAAATYILRVRPRVKGGGERVVRGRKPIEAALKGTDFDGLDLLPADFTYRHMDLMLDRTKQPTRRLERVLEPLRDEYDLLILDCPPSVSLVSENVLYLADEVLSPLIPTTLSVRTLEQLADLALTVKRRPEVLGFFSMVDRRKRLHRDVVEQLPLRHKNIATTAIPAQSLIEQMAARRAPVPYYAPRSVATRCYEQLFDEAITGRRAAAAADRGAQPTPA
jgi:cellulose biosynthesis protein BcsQ